MWPYSSLLFLLFLLISTRISVISTWGPYRLILLLAFLLNIDTCHSVSLIIDAFFSTNVKLTFLSIMTFLKLESGLLEDKAHRPLLATEIIQEYPDRVMLTLW